MWLWPWPSSRSNIENYTFAHISETINIRAVKFGYKVASIWSVWKHAMKVWSCDLHLGSKGQNVILTQSLFSAARSYKFISRLSWNWMGMLKMRTTRFSRLTRHVGQFKVRVQEKSFFAHISETINSRVMKLAPKDSPTIALSKISQRKWP